MTFLKRIKVINTTIILQIQHILLTDTGSNYKIERKPRLCAPVSFEQTLKTKLWTCECNFANLINCDANRYLYQNLCVKFLSMPTI